MRPHQAHRTTVKHVVTAPGWMGEGGLAWGLSGLIQRHSDLLCICAHKQDTPGPRHYPSCSPQARGQGPQDLNVRKTAGSLCVLSNTSAHSGRLTADWPHAGSKPCPSGSRTPRGWLPSHSCQGFWVKEGPGCQDKAGLRVTGERASGEISHWSRQCPQAPWRCVAGR